VDVFTQLLVELLASNNGKLSLFDWFSSVQSNSRSSRGINHPTTQIHEKKGNTVKINWFINITILPYSPFFRGFGWCG
jgi:outer membrane protease